MSDDAAELTSEEDVDVVEAEDDDGFDDENAEPSLAEDLAGGDDEDEDLEADELDTEEADALTDSSAEVDEQEAEEGLGTGGTAVVVPPEASFDDEEDADAGLVAAVAGEGGDEIEGLKDGEFVCRSCYIAKRDTQLADPERLYCRDCA